VVGMVKSGLQILLVNDLDCKSKPADFLNMLLVLNNLLKTKVNCQRKK
jgi:hypothetical protein